MVHALATFNLAFSQDANTEPEAGFNLDLFADLTLAARLAASPVKKLTSKEKRAGLVPTVDPKGVQTTNFLLCLGRALSLIME